MCAIIPVARIRDPGTPRTRLACQILAWHLALTSLSLLFSEQMESGM